MQSSHSKVIGFFAYRSRDEVVCVEHDACLIAGSEEAMRQYVREFAGRTSALFTIRKTRFGEILDGIRIGAAYGFDEESYSRFLPLARAAGLQAADADFKKAHAQGLRFFTFRTCGMHLGLTTWRCVSSTNTVNLCPACRGLEGAANTHNRPT
jgi:hypothetical protein